MKLKLPIFVVGSDMTASSIIIWRVWPVLTGKAYGRDGPSGDTVMAGSMVWFDSRDEELRHGIVEELSPGKVPLQSSYWTPRFIV